VANCSNTSERGTFGHFFERKKKPQLQFSLQHIVKEEAIAALSNKM
jgi:hypothetical protein